VLSTDPKQSSSSAAAIAFDRPQTKSMNAARFDQHLVSADTNPTSAEIRSPEIKSEDAHPRVFCGK
jgi:hypothetical protein